MGGELTTPDERELAATVVPSTGVEALYRKKSFESRCGRGLHRIKKQVSAEIRIRAPTTPPTTAPAITPPFIDEVWETAVDSSACELLLDIPAVIGATLGELRELGVMEELRVEVIGTALLGEEGEAVANAPWPDNANGRGNGPPVNDFEAFRY